jgi:hypothetical protein
MAILLCLGVSTGKWRVTRKLVILLPIVLFAHWLNPYQDRSREPWQRATAETTVLEGVLLVIFFCTFDDPRSEKLSCLGVDKKSDDHT